MLKNDLICKKTRYKLNKITPEQICEIEKNFENEELEGHSLI